MAGDLAALRGVTSHLRIIADTPSPTLPREAREGGGTISLGKARAVVATAVIVLVPLSLGAALYFGSVRLPANERAAALAGGADETSREIVWSLRAARSRGVCLRSTARTCSRLAGGAAPQSARRSVNSRHVGRRIAGTRVLVASTNRSRISISNISLR